MTTLIFYCCLGLCAQAQNKEKLYTAKIITSKSTISGALFECTDSTITVVDIELAKSGANPAYHDIQVIPVTDLVQIRVRRTGAIRRTALTLGVIGGLTGVIAGLAGRPEEDDMYGVVDTFSAGYYAVQGALIGVTIGGALGVATGSASKKYKINGQIDKYHHYKAELTKYLYAPLP